MIAKAATQSGSLSQTGSLRPTGLAKVVSLDSNGVSSSPIRTSANATLVNRRLHDAHREREIKNLSERREEEIGCIDQRQNVQEPRDAPCAAVR